MEFHCQLSPIYYLFSPPYEFNNVENAVKKSFNWQSKNHHNIHWNEGDRTFCSSCIMRHIKEVFPAWDLGLFYVMESQPNGQKIKTLKSLFPFLDIVNYNVTFKTLPLLTNNISCLYREHGDHRAYLKCMRMLQHYADSKYNL